MFAYLLDQYYYYTHSNDIYSRHHLHLDDMYLHQKHNYYDGDEEHVVDDVEMERIEASEIFEETNKRVSKYPTNYSILIHEY